MASYNTKEKKKQMLKALDQSMGIVKEAAQLIEIDRRTHYLWMDKDTRYRQKVLEMENKVLDMAERKLYEMVLEKNTAAVIFLLQTRGKRRGYIKDPEITINNQQNQLQINAPDLIHNILEKTKREDKRDALREYRK